MEKVLRDRLLKFEDLSMSPEDLKEATLFTLRALKAHLEETKPAFTYDISFITQAIDIAELNFAE